ncbi:class I SAM-dependent methyltransferase [Streptomyces jeddahensis]|uniref:Ubiquinone/menaquinone biosynthesis C-methyltransferase UbiE n=1 Tax=Streptomyces jeddahensis TaxID=1716141 RepID=A0A177HNL7_9ACTN|nr:class I SAM-dependent methyltransferase [Streptomyces jeddahensis]OAH12601.1 ubiquinone/menaquinone biosynthesis C-methyltransferase UbiE [Streptomyces jeddahensis]
MFTPQGPTFLELTVQALSSTERGYDLLAPKFDQTPFRTPDRLLDAVACALRPLGPFQKGLDVCCGTGAGVGVLRELCEERVTGVDFSAGMLSAARSAFPHDQGGTDPGCTDDHGDRAEPGGPGDRGRTGGGPVVDWVRADARALPFRPVFDLAVSFGAFGHFLPHEQGVLFAQVHAALRPGGRFAFPIVAPPRVGSRLYWALWSFDVAMRVRNAVWRPRFVMYYRTFRLSHVCRELRAAGFSVELLPLLDLGRQPDGSPRCRLVVARRV